MSKKELIKKLKQYLRNKPEVILAFLFGSAAKGRGYSKSDVDIAFYFTDSYNKTAINCIWSDIEYIFTNQGLGILSGIYA